MSRPRKKFIVECHFVGYDGDGLLMHDIIEWQDETTAVSEKQAINNCRFKHGKSSQYDWAEIYGGGTILNEYYVDGVKVI